MYSVEMNSYFAGMLEKFMIPKELWHIVPDKVKEHIYEDGHPEGIAHHPVHGWAVLSAGQGPSIQWADMPEEDLDKAILDCWNARETEC